MSTIELPTCGDRDHVSGVLQRTFQRPDATLRAARISGKRQLPTERGRATELGLRRVGGFALLLAAALTVVAVAVHPPHDFGVDAGVLVDVRRNRDAWIAAHLLFLGLTILMIMAFLALATIVRETRPCLAAVALASSLAGTVGQMGFLGIDFTMWQMAAPEADPKQMTAVIERLEASTAIGFPLYGLVALLGVGAALLLYGLIRSGAVSPTLAITVVLGSGLAVGFSERIVGVAGLVLAMPGVLWLGWRLAWDPQNVVTTRPCVGS